MKTLRFLAIAFGVCALASAQNINVQKASTTNNITGNLTIGSGKTLLGDTGSMTNFATVGVGTGTTAPATNLQVIDTATATPRGITNDQYNIGTNGAQMNWRKARGTFATPTTLVSGDLLGRAIFWGYDGTGFIESGNLRFTSLGTIGTNRVPSVFDVYVSTDAAPSVLTLTASFSGTAGISMTPLGSSQNVTFNTSGTGFVDVATTGFRIPITGALLTRNFANSGNNKLISSDNTSSDRTLIYVQGNAVIGAGGSSTTDVRLGVGTVTPSYPLEVTGSSTSDRFVRLSNTNSGNAAAGAAFFAQVGGASAGDPYLGFDVNGVGGWSIGLDNSDNDNLKFDTGGPASPGSGTKVVVVQATGDALFGGLTVDGIGKIQVPSHSTTAGGINVGGPILSRTTDGVLTSSTQFRGPTAGNAATPAISVGDLDTGIYRPAGGQLALSSGGILQLTVTTTEATFANRVVGASFGSASAAAVAVRYNSTSSITVNNATSTGLQFNNYGAGALSTDASGNITATSDGRLKNIVGAFARGLTSIRNLHPATYRWKKESGMDTEHDYTGFVAQDVQAAIPEAIGKTPDGFLTFSDRPVLAAAVNAINELDGKTVSKTEIRIFEFIALAALVLAIRANVRKNHP